MQIEGTIDTLEILIPFIQCLFIYFHPSMSINAIHPRQSTHVHPSMSIHVYLFMSIYPFLSMSTHPCLFMHVHPCHSSMSIHQCKSINVNLSMSIYPCQSIHFNPSISIHSCSSILVPTIHVEKFGVGERGRKLHLSTL